MFSFATLVAVAGFAAGVPGDPSNAAARRILGRAVASIGGEAALAALGPVRREMTDEWVDTGQGQHPWAGVPDADHLPVHFPQAVVSFIDYAGGRWYESRRFDDGPGDYGVQVQAASGAGGFETFTYTEERPYRRDLGGDEIAAQTARRLRRYPEGLLRLALARAATLRSIGGGEAIALTDPAGESVSLYFDAATSLLVKSTAARDHPVLGDTIAETLYSDYRRVGGLLMPFLLVDRVGGVPTHRWSIATTELGGAPPPSAFTPPGDFVRVQDAPPEPTLQARGGGVYEILGLYNVLFAVFRDHVLLVEAPVGEAYTEACLALVRSVAPGKPVRAVATHFHYDHLGGARTLVGNGIPIATTPDAVEVIRRAVGARLDRRPDRLAREPRAPRLEAIAGSRVFADAEQRVEIYDFGPTPHVAQILVAYVPGAKTLLVADLLDVLSAEMAIPGIDTMVMIEKIRERRLDVERIVPMHGVPITIADLNRGLAVRARHVPGTPLEAKGNP